MRAIVSEIPAWLQIMVALSISVHLAWRSVKGPLRSLARGALLFFCTGVLLAVATNGWAVLAGVSLIGIGLVIAVTRGMACNLSVLLPYLNTEQTIAVFSYQLQSDFDSDVREQAALALGESGEESARPVLLEALSIGDPHVRRAVIQALSELQKDDEASVDALARFLADPHEMVRAAAANGLRFSLPMAIAPLMTALSDDSADVRREAVLALESLRAAQAFDAVAGLLLTDPDASVREYAAGALGVLNADCAIIPLQEAMRDVIPEVRHAAIVALGESGNIQALPLLCQGLKDHDPESREAAAAALAELLQADEPGGEMALGPLCEALKDTEPSVRQQTANALGSLGDDRAVSFLVTALQDQDSNVRESALKALARIDDDGNSEHLLEALHDENVYVQRQAAQLVKWRGADVVQQLRRHVTNPSVDHFVKAYLAESVSHSGEFNAAQVLLAVLQHEESMVKESALKALANLKDKSTASAVMPMLSHADEAVRGQAALTLAAIGDDDAIQPLCEMLHDSHPYVRRRAVWSLSFFDSPVVTPLLVERLDDADESVQAAAIQALSEICDEDSLSGIVAGLPEALRKNVEDIWQELDADQDGRNTPRNLQLGTLHYE